MYIYKGEPRPPLQPVHPLGSPGDIGGGLRQEIPVGRTAWT